MNKLTISKEWTDKERIALIYLITSSAFGSRRILNRIEMEEILFLSDRASSFLENNRRNFSKYLTPDQ